MSESNPQAEPVPAWQKTATVAVYALVVVAFLYLGWAWYVQRTFSGLVSDLLSDDSAKSSAAALKLAATDDALPYLTDALVNRPDPEDRVLAAKVLLRRLCRKSELEPAADLSAGLDLEAVTRALSDESPEVRAAALAVVELAGTRANYQRNRVDEMRQFEGWLKGLASADVAEHDAAAESFRTAGERALPYLAGTAFSEDRGVRLRGLAALRASVQEILKSSNQARIVPLLGRRRCRVLLAELPRLGESDRALVVDVLNVGGRLSPDFFSGFLKAWPTLDAPAREALLAERVESLEQAERRRGGESDAGKIEELHDKTR